METCIVRVWLPDRPGALGEVATAIGAVQAEIVGIDILERCAGRAIDELAVQLPHAATVPRLVSSIRAVPGVDIEDLRLLDDATHDPRSEEHTSELQSLMRISYAVFCLKKKNNHK